MNVTVSIIDQHVRGLAERRGTDIVEVLGKAAADETFRRSAAFVLLCVKTMLGMGEEEALECLTEGGNDFGVDAIHVADVADGEFTVTLFQGKYKHVNLDGTAGFPEDGVLKAVNAVRFLFDLRAKIDVNPRLEASIEEVRSLILDGYIPRVRFLLCNNGMPWKRPEAQAIIDREDFPTDQVLFEHVNHDTLIQIIQAPKPIKDTILFSGRAIVEDFNFSRVFIGKVSVREIARIMDTHGDRLLERNIRRYLGLQSGHRVNLEIRRTLLCEEERPNFFFYNNGITLICNRFDLDALQKSDYRVLVEGLQIINGGQTCKTIQTTLSDLRGNTDNLDIAFVLVRLYQLSEKSSALASTITYTTNSQNPVDLRDLRSNDPVQQRLELSIRELGYGYRRQRSDSGSRGADITSGTAAEAVLSVWRRRPQQAKFMSSEHFGKLYGEIFNESLSGAQTVIAVLLFRIAENKRRRPPAGAPEFVRYASCFSAMLMGEYLLGDLGISSDRLEQLDHRRFTDAKELVEQRGEEYFERATVRLQKALTRLYGERPVSLQRLAATFRRGDLLEYLYLGGDLFDDAERDRST
jgi:hypothetical protein